VNDADLHAAAQPTPDQVIEIVSELGANGETVSISAVVAMSAT
jgi:hypothetical protein